MGDQMLGDELSRSLLDLTTSAISRHRLPTMQATHLGSLRGKICWMTSMLKSTSEKTRPPKERRKKKQAEKQQRQWQKRFEQTLKSNLKRKKRKGKKLRQQRRKRRLLQKLKS